MRFALFFLFVACTTTGVLTRTEASALATRTWPGATEEVYDATWLTLLGQGFVVVRSDRVAGTLEVSRAGKVFDVDVAALGTEQRVEIAPRDPLTRAELTALLDALEEGTRSFLRAWDELPEWSFDGRRNLLRVPGFGVAPPAEWEWLDFDISRRFVVVQQRRARTGLNPTLLVELDRRRPESRFEASLKRAAGLALVARQRLVLPEELEATEDEQGLHGSVRVLDGTSPHELSWHAYQTVLGASDVRLLMVCPLACREAWAEVMNSLALRSGERVGVRGDLGLR
ncbi:MAG: hypothetical protein Q8N23_11770 [Archangium sp.]|nr:hypothetical protein [Archangium sp.]MDP3573497.1 hypothetical protein [Archangium sp.]